MHLTKRRRRYLIGGLQRVGHVNNVVRYGATGRKQMAGVIFTIWFG